MNKKQVLAHIETHKVISIFRIPDSKKLEPVIEAIYEGGIRAIEITMTMKNALSLIENLSNKVPSDMLVGVGSVLDADTTGRAVDAGASFVVSPVVKAEVIKKANERDVVVIPGAFSPTEIQHAWELGADLIKVFPADIVGMSYFRAVLAPLPHLKLVPTRGVTLENGNEWLNAGAFAVGVVDTLYPEDTLQAGDYDQVRENAKLLMKNLNS